MATTVSKRIFKLIALLIGTFATMFLLFSAVLYSFLLRPLLNDMKLDNVRIEMETIDISGFPSNYKISIKNPELWSNQELLWKGDNIELSWRLFYPTAITAKLTGRHILTFQRKDLEKGIPTKKLYFRDTTGFIKLTNYNKIVVDIKGHKMSLYSGTLEENPTYLKTMAIDTLYFSYDGPTSLLSSKEGGNYNISAENIALADVFTPPFPEPITRFSIRATYNEKIRRYNVSNLMVIWNDLRLAGKGTTDATQGGNYIIAVIAFDKLLQQLQKNNHLSGDKLSTLINEYNKLMNQQKKSTTTPVYMSANHYNDIVSIMNIPIFSLPDLYSPESVIIQD